MDRLFKTSKGACPGRPWRETRLEYEIPRNRTGILGNGARNKSRMISIKRYSSNGQHTRTSGPAQVVSPCRLGFVRASLNVFLGVPTLASASASKLHATHSVTNKPHTHTHTHTQNE